MGQLYIQLFRNQGEVAKDVFNKEWGVALEAFAKSGNWGAVDKGVKHLGTYGTSWGGYVLLDVEDPEAFSQYIMFHYQNYGPTFQVTFEPVFDMDAALAPMIKDIKAKF